MSNITIRLHGVSCLTFTGREAWTLLRLIEAGDVGVTTIDHSASRWSHYIFKLRRARLTISTEYEPHIGSFPGTYGRYRLKTLVTVVSEVTA